MQQMWHLGTTENKFESCVYGAMTMCCEINNLHWIAQMIIKIRFFFFFKYLLSSV